MSKKKIDIISFEEKYAKDFHDINIEWLEAFFYVEEHDRVMLSNPKEYIIDKGGQILFAKIEGKIVGTVALIKHGPQIFELSKMGVYSQYRGMKIGLNLMKAAIDYSRAQGWERVWLESNRILTPALTLYSKMGFVEVPLDPDTPYERCDIRMELILTDEPK